MSGRGKERERQSSSNAQSAKVLLHGLLASQVIQVESKWTQVDKQATVKTCQDTRMDKTHTTRKRWPAVTCDRSPCPLSATV